MLGRLVKKYGVIRASVAVTLFSILVSVFLSFSICTLANSSFDTLGLGIAIAVPALIAPLFCILELRMVYRLEKVQEQLRELSIRDPLTGAFNRRHLIQIAEREFARAKRYAQVFSVILFDLDDFKNINDTLGHAAGDHVLRAITQLCQEHSRTVDTFARYGGEEFVFLVPLAGQDQAFAFAERIRQIFSETRFSYEQNEIHVTASVGVVTFDALAPNLDAMLIAADKALYDAKREGKNRTIVAQSLMPDLTEGSFRDILVPTE